MNAVYSRYFQGKALHILKKEKDLFLKKLKMNYISSCLLFVFKSEKIIHYFLWAFSVIICILFL
jgi:hypothetical protein